MSSCKNLLAALLFLAAAASLCAKPMSVTVKETQARATPSFLGKVAATLVYGDRVEVLEERGGWVRVTLPGGKGSGWVHGSALTEKRIVLKAGASNVEQTASGAEVALAGKGFNKEVEAQYRQNTDLDYTWVDRMELFLVSTQQISAFLRQGELAPLLGGLQ